MIQKTVHELSSDVFPREIETTGDYLFIFEPIEIRTVTWKLLNES